MKRILALAILLIASSALFAQNTYYVDAVSGIDTNTATQAKSKTTPWQHLPGMATCTNACASYSAVAGDRFILKGGVTWPNASFPITWTWSGSSGSPIYIGVDQTWYTGSSWSRPIFNAGGSVISGANNDFIYIIGYQYVTFDNIEMTGFYWTGAGSFGHLSYIDIRTSDYITLTNLYLHNWTHAAGADDSNCYIVLGDGGSPFSAHSTFDNGIIQNADGRVSDGASGSCAALFHWGNAHNNVIHDMPTAILPSVGGTKEISGNQIYNIVGSIGGVHPNAIETVGNGAASGTEYIHDNIIHDISLGESLTVGNPLETVYAWNNVIYNLLAVGANPPHFPQNAGTAGLAAYFWNNTVVAYSSNPCFGQNGTTPMTNLTIQNNHCITTGTTTSGITTTSPVVSYNLLQTPTVATGQGYTTAETFSYSPSSGSASTVGAGVNLTSSFAGIGYATSDTNYACSANSANQVVCPSRVVNTRPSSGAWDVGAYQYPPIYTVTVPSSKVFSVGTLAASGSASIGTSTPTVINNSGITTPTVGAGTSLQVAGGTPMTSQSSANSQIVTCPTGGTSTQYCGADGAWHTAILSTTTGSIGGSLLALGCTSEGTVTVTGATTSMACLMSGVGGNPANVQPQCSVTAPNTVTTQFCTAVAVAPAAQTYAIRVF